MPSLEKFSPSGLPQSKLEHKVDELAQEADTSTTVNALVDKLTNFVKGSQSNSIIDGIAALIDAFT